MAYRPVVAGLDFLKDEGFRLDGRQLNELRHTTCKFGIRPQADGSCFIEQGNIKVVCSVFGPHEGDASKQSGRSSKSASQGFVNCQYLSAGFSSMAEKTWGGGRADRKVLEQQQRMRETLELVILVDQYSSSQIDIVFEVLQADGSTFCTCLNAAAMALVDAGVSLRDLPCSCSSTLLEDQAVTDSSHQEELSGNAQLNLVLSLRGSETILFSQLTGQVHVDYFDRLFASARLGCLSVHKWMTTAVKEHIQRMNDSMVQS